MVLCEARYNERMDSKERGELLRRYREKAGLTRAQVGEILGVSDKAVGHYETGTNDIGIYQLQLLADYYGVSIDELVGRPAPPAPEPLLPVYPPGPVIQVPVYGAIRAGEPMMVREEFVEYESVDADDFQKGDFYLEVTGDSMIGDYIPPGARVLVRPQLEVQPYEIAVINVHQEDATLGRVRFIDGKAVITKSNPNYIPQFYPIDEIRVVGRVVRWIVKPKLKNGG